MTQASPSALRQAKVDSVVVWAERTNVGPKPLSPAVLGMVVEHLDADTLSHLAVLRRAQEREQHLRLSVAAVEELAAMVTDGCIPTIGWWRRHLRQRHVRRIEA